MAMHWAIRDAGIMPSRIGYINAHGTGTQINDAMETEAIRRVFATTADTVLVSSTKSVHGHTLGAAGAIEAVTSMLALRHGAVPPTANFTTADPACVLNLVVNHPRAAQLEYALSNTFAFGGLNAALVLKRFEG